MAGRRGPVEPDGIMVEPTRSDGETAELIFELQACTHSEVDALRDRFCRHLFAEYAQPIYAYLKIILDDDHEAEDATQEVMARAMAAAESYDANRAPFRIWLFRVARNHALNHRRKHSQVDVTSPWQFDLRCEVSSRLARLHGDLALLPDDAQFPSDSRLLDLIGRLSVEQRQVVVLRFMLDLSLKETAEILGCTENAVSKLQGRALGFLRARLARRRATSGTRAALAIGRCDRGSRVLTARRRALSFLGRF